MDVQTEWREDRHGPGGFPRAFVRTCDGLARTVPEVRHALLAWLASVGCDAGVRDAAALVVSELTANAVQAAPGEAYRVRTTLDGDRISIAVRSRAVDDRTPPPAERWAFAEPFATRGRGLAIVMALADRVDVERPDPSSVVVTAWLPTGGR